MLHSGGRTEIDRHGDANSRFFEILQMRLTIESYGSADVQSIFENHIPKLHNISSCTFTEKYRISKY
jgi:hypothetical protein